MLVAVLAILRAGAAYLPLDPTFPKDRLAFMMADAGVRMVITHATAFESLPESDVRVFDVNRILDRKRDRDQPPVERPFPQVVPEQLAYTMYTSGFHGSAQGCANLPTQRSRSDHARRLDRIHPGGAHAPAGLARFRRFHL